MRKIILIIGDDKMGRRAIANLSKAFPNIMIYRNRSGNPARIAKLIKNKSLPLPSLLYMVLAEIYRPNLEVPDYPLLCTNQEVRDMLVHEKPDEVICFRAGLVLTEKTLACEPTFLNLHCADLPKWGGLGTIYKALKAGAYNQNACLHEMVGKIDAGQIYYRQPYKLDPFISYKANEDRSIESGIILLKNYLSEVLS